MSDLLKIEAISSGYGSVEVLRDLSLRVGEGEAVCVLGANGAGKSTLLKSIVGIAHVGTGSIHYGRPLRDVTGHSPEHLVRQGIALVPEGRQLFGSMSVEENLSVGSYALRSRGKAQQRPGLLREVYELFPVLDERRTQEASTLSGGEQQMLAIGRALMSAPELILLDEPSFGLAPRVVREIFEVFKSLRSKGLTVVVVEQDARLALEFADRGYVMQTGSIVLEGSSDELLGNDEVREIYLGSWKGKGRAQ